LYSSFSFESSVPSFLITSSGGMEDGFRHMHTECLYKEKES